MKSFRTSALIGLALAASFALARPARAQQAAPAVKAQPALVVSAENRTAGEAAARGTRRADQTVHAGDVLRYRLTFTNTAGRPVRHVALSNPLVGGLQFVSGSASASREDASAEYSADGGRSWSARPMETVMVDGRSVERPIAPERYTAVRWIVSGWVNPGATVTAQFEARLAAR